MTESAAPCIHIERRPVGRDHPCCVVAEIGVNHNGDPALAEQLIRDAHTAGADAVKLQMFVPEQLAGPEAALCAYQQAGSEGRQDQLSMLKALALPMDAIRHLQAFARKTGITLFASVFDPASLKQALALDMPAIKFGAGELTCLPLHRMAARSGKPVIISCGMAETEEIRPIVQVYREAGAPFMLLHCVSAYPAAPEALNLRSIAFLGDAFQCPVGFSDHTMNIDMGALAVAAGASMIEKHVTTDNDLPGPDHKASMTPPDFMRYMDGIRKSETIMGDYGKHITAAELENRDKVRKRIVLHKTCDAGHTLTEGDIAFRRPGAGMSPMKIDAVIGKTLARPKQAGEPLLEEDLKQ